MNLHESFIELNHLSMRIDSLWLLLKQYNSVIAGKVRPFDMRELYDKIKVLQNEKLELRKKIAIAMSPVRPYLIEKKEIKIQMRSINTIVCNQGAHKTVFDRTLRVMEAEFKDDEIEAIKISLEERLKKCEVAILRLYSTIEI
jgi:hypothetical protein